MSKTILGKVPSSPTSPTAQAAADSPENKRRRFDVADLYRDPSEPIEAKSGLDEKFRKTYYWITNYAMITPFYDVEFDEGPSSTYQVGDSKAKLALPSGPSYSSFVLIPLLNLIARKKCLFVGGPGRGKTASAVLMGVMSGYSLRDVKRGIQHGQPQMTVSDLFGSPVPADIMKCESLKDIRISWKSWLGMRVKIIDEYNRIPTRTQSALLLTVMADDYAEMMDQVFDCPEAAWYLTANDDAGGGTYEVIEALRDRIDVVVRALHFNSRFLGQLLSRIEAGIKPEEAVPPEIIFTPEELARARSELLAIDVPPGVLRRLEHFASQFEFFEPAGSQFEYRTKDAVKVSGGDFARLAASETGKDKLAEFGDQTRNGLSVRALMTSIVFVKALAYFRGEEEASLDDARAILPFVFHDKLVQNPDASFFEQSGNGVFRVDRVAWLRGLFDRSCAEYDKLGLDDADEVGAALAVLAKGLDGVSLNSAEAEIARVEKLIARIASGRKLSGPLYDDLLSLKYLHQRWGAYIRWLKWRG